MAARLLIYSAWRKSKREETHLHQSIPHDADRRSLARRGLDVRDLGRVPRDDVDGAPSVVDRRSVRQSHRGTVPNPTRQVRQQDSDVLVYDARLAPLPSEFFGPSGQLLKTAVHEFRLVSGGRPKLVYVGLLLVVVSCDGIVDSECRRSCQSSFVEGRLGRSRNRGSDLGGDSVGAASGKIFHLLPVLMRK